MKIHKIAYILVIIGGLNWLLTGLMSSWNLGSYVGGSVARIIYLLVGISALYELFTHKRACRACEPKMGGQM